MKKYFVVMLLISISLSCLRGGAESSEQLPHQKAFFSINNKGKYIFVGTDSGIEVYKFQNGTLIRICSKELNATVHDIEIFSDYAVLSLGSSGIAIGNISMFIENPYNYSFKIININNNILDAEIYKNYILAGGFIGNKIYVFDFGGRNILNITIPEYGYVRRIKSIDDEIYVADFTGGVYKLNIFTDYGFYFMITKHFETSGVAYDVEKFDDRRIIVACSLKGLDVVNSENGSLEKNIPVNGYAILIKRYGDKFYISLATGGLLVIDRDMFKIYKTKGNILDFVVLENKTAIIADYYHLSLLDLTTGEVRSYECKV